MGEVDITSITFGFIIFVIIVLGGGLFMSHLFNSYSLTDDNPIDGVTLNITGLQQDLKLLQTGSENAQDESNPSTEDTGDNPFSAVGKVIKQLDALKTIRLKVTNIIDNALNKIVPNFVTIGIYALLAFLIVMLLARIWIKIRP